MRQAVGSSGSVSSLDSISEDEESAYNEDFDKDMAYVVHIDPHVPSALQALFSEDTGDEGTVSQALWPGRKKETR